MEQWEKIKNPVFIQKIPSVGVLTNVKRRVYGIVWEWTNWRNPPNIFGAIPYLAHSGVNWKEFSDARAEKNLYNQHDWGRGVETLLCEALISQQLPGFHFLPTKELDLSYKTDLISRIAYLSPHRGGVKLKTVSIGSQITVMQIPENVSGWNSYDTNDKRKKYDDKMKQVELMNEYLHLPNTRAELEGVYGKLTLPDIMCFIGVNGTIRKTFSTESSYLRQEFKKWKESGFITDSLIQNFKPHIWNALIQVATFISWSQGFILSKDFLYHPDLIKKKYFSVKITDHITIMYDPDTGKLDCLLMEWDHILSKITYFFIQDDIKKLQTQYTQNIIWKNIKNPSS